MATQTPTSEADLERKLVAMKTVMTPVFGFLEMVVDEAGLEPEARERALRVAIERLSEAETACADLAAACRRALG